MEADKSTVTCGGHSASSAHPKCGSGRPEAGTADGGKVTGCWKGHPLFFVGRWWCGRGDGLKPQDESEGKVRA